MGNCAAAAGALSGGIVSSSASAWSWVSSRRDRSHQSSNVTWPRRTARCQSAGSPWIGRARCLVVSSSTHWNPSLAQCMAYFVS